MVKVRIDVPIDRVRELAKAMHPQRRVAALLGISHDTLENRLKEPEYRAAFDEGRQLGCAEVCDLQMEAARALNPSVLIWLGKQYLGQKDVVETQHTGPDGGPIEFHVIYREPRPIVVDIKPSPQQITNGYAKD